MTHLFLAVIYLSFVSLGLPDSLLGAAWPAMYIEFGVPVSYAGIISTVIAMSTVVSSLQSDRLTKKLGTGKVTLLSVATTATALMGFSLSRSFWALCLWAVPYGLGAGSVDASLNNYVALHYESRHMSWLHCMWGIGASLGPYIMGCVLTGGQGWNYGYRYIAFLQIVLTAILLFSLPLWKKCATDRSSLGENFTDGEGGESAANAGESAAGPSTCPPLSLRQIVSIPGAKEVMTCFFAYSAIEQTAGLWASSYLVMKNGLSTEAAAGCAALFFVGITVGRVFSGFLTIRFNDTQMIRLGEAIVAVGIGTLLLPLETTAAFLGLLLIGLGCAPIYPCIMHSTPDHFGAARSQALMGVQTASGYVGTCVMPPLFGLLAGRVGLSLFPGYLLAALIFMGLMQEQLLRKTPAIK